MRARTFRRLLIMVIALVGLVYGFFWWVGQQNDFQLGSTTTNMIAAQKFTESGAQAVVIDKQGNVIASKGYSVGSDDRDLAWDPQGNRLFFISDRKEDSFHIFRWDPQRNSDPDQKSIDKAGRSNLAFDVEDTPAKELSGLVTVRGTVQEFFPKTARSQQVMPPSPKERVSGSDEDGAGSAMEVIYKRFGTSFRVAKWMKQRRYILAVMRREEFGETLILQDSEPDDKGNLKQPQVIFTAEKFFVAIDPKTGLAVISIIGVIPPTDKDGKPVKLAFKHGVFIFEPEKAAEEILQPVALSPDDNACFGQLAVSPDGSQLIFASGPYSEDGNLTVKGLVSCPLRLQGGQSGSPIVMGAIADATFSPDGSKIAYTKREGDRRPIFLADKDGSNAVNLTGNSGDFAYPIFSPQYK